MERFEITPDEAEQLVAGRALERDDLSELRDFLRSAAAMTRGGPSETTARLHLAAIADAISHPQAAPVTRSPRMRSILRTRTFKAVAGAVAAVLAMGGLAAAQTLPAPAQDAVAAVAERVGISLPHSDGTRGADHDDDGVADDRGLHTGQTGTKRGADHDGDGEADDNGLHTGQTGTKRGADHDGDGEADDNGLHTGQTGTKRGTDHDGDGVADDNGVRGRPDSDGDDQDDNDNDNDNDDDRRPGNDDDQRPGNGRGLGRDNAPGRDSDDEPQTD